MSNSMMTFIYSFALLNRRTQADDCGYLLIFAG
jgi:hypothetical protein